ncbi:putative condensin complex subunit [Phytophthora cinnamomi]|uniref:putative condensin complex subunit n=1 Tax=Phytophthora cinnamomi TaxID=4785 RepID=UPI00355A8278|nr:putative condensin complex subunit [Phytophthora cinnamomi]
MEFLVPLHAADLELAKAGRYHVQSVLTFEDETAAEISARVQRLEDQVLGSEAGLELLQEDALDVAYSLVKKLPALSEPLRMRVVEMLAAFVSNATQGVLARRPASDGDGDDVALYRSAFKASVYFLVTALTSVSSLQVQAEKDVLKQKGKKGQASALNRLNWSKVVEGAIHKLNRSVNPATFSMWNMNVPEEEFSMLYCKVVFELLGNAPLCRSKSFKPKLYHLLAMSLHKAPAIHISVVASLIDLIYTHEHLSASIAELVELLYFKYANMTFAADLISEIGKISSRDASKDVAGTRNIAMFLSSLSTLTPALIMGNLSFVLALLDSEAYQLRNAAVTCVAQILLWNFRQSGQDPQSTSVEDAVAPKKKTRKERKNDGETKSDGSGSDTSDDEDGSSSGSDEEDTNKTATQAPRTFSRSTRDQLLTVLEDRVHDVNSFARGHVLKMWALLCEEGALPLHMLKNVTLMAVGRLQDKAAVVRRHSIHLLSLLLERNPFMGNLDRDFYAKKRDELTEEMKRKRDEVIAGAEKEMSEALGEIAIQNDDATAPSSPQPVVSSEEHAAALEKELQTTVRLLKFYQDAIDFIDEFEQRALPLMGQLLGSKSISDVLEAIQFFEKAYRFHLGAAQTGIKKVLPLTWRSDVSIQEQLSNTFVSLFIRIDEDDPERNSPQLVAENLVKFLDECTVAEYTCLERIMGELHRSQKIPMVVISSLWALVDVTVYPISVVSNALVLLSMIANIDDSMLFSNDRLGQVLSMGFGDVACSPDSRYRVLGAACRLVQCIQLEPKGATVKSNSQTQRRIQRSNLDATEQIILRLQRFLALDFVGDNGIELECLHSTWFDTVQQAIEAIFSICERPEDVCGDVIKHLSLRLFESETNDVSRVELAHFFFVLGHSAVKVAIHVEKLAAKVKKMRGNRTAAARPADNTASNGDAEDVTAMEDELGVAAEVEAEEDTFVNNIIQKEIACRNLLGMYGPLIIRVLVGTEEAFKNDELLTECAVVALSKFMAVSEEFCEKHLQLLFTILQDSPQPSVRGDVIIALGDLSFRFPNLVEPWTSHLYNRLRDVNLNVRKNTIVVLSHLILNDMIKVKGQISEIAISLVDENDGIRNLAKLFFFELSKKGNNPIYNMLPDAIGQLSTSELVSNSDFQTITRFLIQFIAKEKQIESIVEKLSQRFPTASKAQQQRDLAYCLARLPHTEKSLKYLYQNRKLYSDALHDSVVADNFTSLVAKSRRGNSALTATAEMKEAIDKLDQFVVGKKEGKEEDDTMDGDSTERVSSPQAKGRAKRKSSVKGAKTTRATPKKRERAKRKVTRKRVVSEDSSDEE